MTGREYWCDTCRRRTLNLDEHDCSPRPVDTLALASDAPLSSADIESAEDHATRRRLAKALRGGV